MARRRPGAVGVADDRARDVPDRVADHSGRQARRDLRVLFAGDRQHRQRARQRPVGLHGGRLDGPGIRRRIADQHPHQSATPQVGLAGRGRLLERITLGRFGRQHVDVGEQRLGQQVQRVGLEARLDADLGEPPPRDPSADAVGAEQRLEAPPRAHLAAAERRVDVRARDVTADLDLGQEVTQRLLDALPDTVPERPLERPARTPARSEPPR